MNTFIVTSETKVCSHPFRDWYDADDKEQALELAREDAHRYGLPEDTTFTVTEAPALLSISPL